RTGRRLAVPADGRDRNEEDPTGTTRIVSTPARHEGSRSGRAAFVSGRRPYGHQFLPAALLSTIALIHFDAGIGPVTAVKADNNSKRTVPMIAGHPAKSVLIATSSATVNTTAADTRRSTKR